MTAARSYKCHRVSGTPDYPVGTLQLFGMPGYEVYLSKLPLHFNRHDHSSFSGNIPRATASLSIPTLLRIPNFR
jgi:hypothetical protein